MYVVVQHTISEPAAFWNAADPVLSELRTIEQDAEPVPATV